MTRKLVFLMAAGILVVLGLMGCSESSLDTGAADQRLYSVKELMKLDSEKVKAIQVFFGDGTRMVLDQEQDFDPILERVDVLYAQRRSEVDGPGFLFFMDLVQGEQKIRLSSHFEVDGELYSLVGPESKELNSYMVALGRSHNPELLPGIE